MTAHVVSALAAVAREAAHLAAPGLPCQACGAAGGETLADRPDGTVVRHGAAVAKAHAPGTDPQDHRARLAVAAHPALTGILLPPLRLPGATVLPDSTSPRSFHGTPGPPGAPDRTPAPGPASISDPAPASDASPAPDPAPASDASPAPGRPVTVWPYGTPVDPADPDAAPWEEAAVLLARLHRVPPARLPGPIPQMRGPVKTAAAVARMEAAASGHPASSGVRRAWAGLPAWARGEARSPRRDTVCHGDLHLGQLVRHPAPEGRWLLIDVDDLGLGDPAWDLARPAAWFAAGLLPPEVWRRFLGAYVAAGGPAVASADDPWPQLDVPARALTVQTAALALAKAAAEGRRPDEVEGAVIDACTRIGTLPPELEFEAPS